MNDISIPECWVECRISELGDIVTGKTPSTKIKENFDGIIPFIRPSDLDKGGYVYNTGDTLSETGFQFVPNLPKDSVVVTCIGNLGKVGITSKPSATNQQINSIIPFKPLSSKYLYYYLLTMRWWLEKESSATTLPIINKGKFSKAPIILPPLAEQKQIAARLDALLAQVDTLKTRLDAIPTVLKRFRQSVLATAVSGKLTAGWRGLKHQKYNWNITKFDELILESNNGLSKRSGDIGKYYTVLKLSDFKDAKRVFGNERKIILTDTEINKYKLENDDLLVIRVNGSVDLAGLFIVYENGLEEAFCDHFIRFSVDKKKLLSKFFTFIANNGDGRLYLKNSLSTSAGQNTINQKSIKSLEFQLPPIEEQTEIVRRVGQLFAFADLIEQRVAEAKKRVDHLTQSILAKAFRGDLTADWRTQNLDLISGENSAQALLERIMAERSSQKTKKISETNVKTTGAIK